MTEAAVRLYAEGWTLHEVGRGVGVADQTVRRALVEHGVAIRPGERRKVVLAA